VSDEVRAYDRLNDAAPELLEACEALPLDLLDKDEAGDLDAADFTDNAEAFMNAMRIARKAIARATAASPVATRE